jgi:signal transduction histidine kinase/DNA-binding response OmpR family regulator
MDDSYEFSLLTIPLRHDRHVVQARQRARDIAALLGFEHQDQIRLATAASELARNAFRYASGGSVSFFVTKASPQMFIVSVTDKGRGIPNLDEILNGRYVSKTGLGMGLIGTKRLMDHFEIETSSSGARVECGKKIPITAKMVTAALIKAISSELAVGEAADPFQEVERQNQELLKTLADLKEKQEQLADLNRELEDTNRGVVALYAELEQHADDLRKVSDLKTRFLSNLSHEFRTPLSSISSLTRLLLAETDGNLASEQAKQVTYIQKSASELSELVNDLLDLAKVEAGKVDIRPRHFEVGDFFGALRGMLKPLLAGNSLDMSFEATPGLLPLYTDEGKLSQILRNLISNSLKFTRKGHIRVTAESEAGGWIVFRVADTGIGIAAEDQQRIFEEFVQIEGELQNQVKGTGLGLPLSRKLAELLGGSLEVESSLGLGSTFIVKIPSRFGEAPLGNPASAPVDAATGETVLFIEDNRETSFVHRSSLKHSNYRTVFVTNIPEARSVMKEMTPALIVLDRLLEQKDSLHFIEEVRSRGYAGPVLVVSVVDDAPAAISAGAAAFLAKPVPPFALLNTVRELIEGRSSKTILLVDDDEVARYLVGGVLSKPGYRVLEAHGGRDALRMIQADRPDAIVLDISMPDMNGFEVLREIRGMTSLESIPVIIHSSKDFSSQEAEVISGSGAFVYSKQAFSAEDGPRGLLQLLESAGIGS